jgi:uncharacterized membrane protein
VIQKFKTYLYNASFAFNCLLVFLLIFEKGLLVPTWVQPVGRIHPMLLHFPIVLLVICIFWEFFSVFKSSVKNEQNIIGDSLLLITSLTSVMSALMGLLLSKEEGYATDILFWHKWGGTFISLLSILWYVFRQSIRNTKLLLSVTSITALVGIIVTSHLGASITHGENFVLAPVTKEQKSPIVLFDDAIIYTNMVQPILQSKCVSCHNNNKSKGGLLMETFAQLQKGGKNGVLWDSTQNDFGTLLSRVHLPLDNKKHMPPSGRPQLTDEEIKILYYWIHSGASATAKVVNLPASDSLSILAKFIFNTIETDNYSFEAANETKVKSLSNNYRFITPLSITSPALGVEFFGASQYKSEQLKELLPLKEQIVALNLNKIPVTDADLVTIAQFTNLRKLNLSFTNIKGTGLSALTQLKSLKQLSLSGTGVDMTSLGVLSSMSKLTELIIWSTPAQNQNLASLKSQLKNTRIETGFSGDTVVIKLNQPMIENEELILMQPTKLKLKHYVKGVEMRYTVDGTDPDSILSPIFKEDYVLDNSLTLKVKAFKVGWASSEIVERTFFKPGAKIDSISLMNPSEQDPYKKFSASILIDAKKGEDKDFSNGKWMGFKDQPMEILIYLKDPIDVSSVSLSTLVAINSNIFPAQQIQVWAGNNPRSLRMVKKEMPIQPEKSAPTYTKGFQISFKPIKANYLKVVLIPVHKLPMWRSPKGYKGWVFVDEVFLN